MKIAKTKKVISGDANQLSGLKQNPFAKLEEDKRRIAEAVKHDVTLSSLTDIKFVRPI